MTINASYALAAISLSWSVDPVPDDVSSLPSVGSGGGKKARKTKLKASQLTQETLNHFLQH